MNEENEIFGVHIRDVACDVPLWLFKILEPYYENIDKRKNAIYMFCFGDWWRNEKIPVKTIKKVGFTKQETNLSAGLLFFLNNLDWDMSYTRADYLRNSLSTMMCDIDMSGILEKLKNCELSMVNG